jgi:predicted RNase H-like HicB family nuclease
MEAKVTKKKILEVVPNIPLLAVFIIKDNGRFMARCPELDLVTEMDTPEDAFKAIVEMVKEYAQDYKKREEIFTKSPNRAHHKPYIDRILECKDKWALYELIAVKYGHIHL